MTDWDTAPARARWARLRFSVVGPLLSCPPESGELAVQIEELSQKPWKHPTTGELVRFSFKTIERWYYVARQDKDPVAALERKVPKHAGTHPGISAAMAETIRAQYAEHPRWSYQLHHDNLVAQSRENMRLGPAPGYATLWRYMQHYGLLRQRRRRHAQKDGEPFALREQRSFEVSHVMALWHLDFHEGRRKVVTASGERQVPSLLGILDDHSRLCCHLQWYLGETTEALVHGFCQALQKRGLPRAVLSDNGSAMMAAEFREGLERLGILQHTTLAYTPEQNAKQEVFWAQVEGRLMAMLEGSNDTA
jgi:transposase InsO family protein